MAAGAHAIETIEDLSRFLHGWYGEPDGAFALAGLGPFASELPQPLAAYYALLGGLTRPDCKFTDDWGTNMPVATQDMLAGPTQLRKRGIRIDFAFENQGNWSAGFLVSDAASDPEVLSDWADVFEPNR